MDDLTSQLTKEWLARLQESGYRLTSPRRVIIETLASSGRALGAIELYDLCRRQYPRLGLVTVYRTLEKLETLGLIVRVHQKNGCHMFLRAPQGHEHFLLCVSCGQVENFSGDDLGDLIGRISQSSGYLILDHLLQLIGLCRTCRNQTG